MEEARTDNALREAIACAPIDPIGDGKVLERLDTQFEMYRRDTVWGGQLEALLPGISDGGIETGEHPDVVAVAARRDTVLSPGEMQSLERYLAIEAMTLTDLTADPLGTRRIKCPEIRYRHEAGSAVALLRHLLSEKTEPDAFSQAYNDLTGNHLFLPLPSEVIPEAVPAQVRLPERTEQQTPDPERTDKILRLRQYISGQIDTAQKRKAVLEMRDMLAIYGRAEKYAVEIGLANPPILNLSIGDVNLVGKELEEKFRDVPYRLGLAGPKRKEIEYRKNAYHHLILSNNPYGYDGLALGWTGLRNRLQGYLSRYGLDGYIRGVSADGTPGDGSAVCYGGANGMAMAYNIARSALQDEYKPGKRQKIKNKVASFLSENILHQEFRGFNPKILFHTPGFLMTKKVADNAGFQTVEKTTSENAHFMPDPAELNAYFDIHPDVKIFVFTPINNPGSYIAAPEDINRLVSVLQKHGVILINDLAYLGTGDQEQNRELGQALNTYKRRIDVLPMTKIFGQPGLRGGGIFTPDKDLAKKFSTVIRDMDLARSYPMQEEALAYWDFVHMDDLARLRNVYMYRQNTLLDLLKERPDIFDLDGTFSAWDDADTRTEQPATDGNERQGALYLWVKLKDGKTPIDVVKETGLFGTPNGAFYFPDAENKVNYIRFAVGVEPMTDANIRRIREALGV